MYCAFATYGAGTNTSGSANKHVDMDGARWAKLCREVGLFDRAFNLTKADLIFAKAKAKVCVARAWCGVVCPGRGRGCTLYLGLHACLRLCS